MKITLESVPHIPPPYAYRLSIELEESNQGFSVNINWHFTERETLTKAEILDEGFEPDGDFSWKGILPLSWVTYFKSLPTDFQKSEIPAIHGDVQIRVETEEGYLRPKQFDHWILFAQEMFQAGLEAAGVELPLQVHVRSSFDGKQAACEFNVSFQQHQGQVAISASEKPISLQWGECQKLLALFFEGDETADPVKNPIIENSVAFSTDKKYWMVFGKNYHHMEVEWVGKVLALLHLN